MDLGLQGKVAIVTGSSWCCESPVDLNVSCVRR
jgi:hypothetical protein